MAAAAHSSRVRHRKVSSSTCQEQTGNRTLTLILPNNRLQQPHGRSKAEAASNSYVAYSYSLSMSSSISAGITAGESPDTGPANSISKCTSCTPLTLLLVRRSATPFCSSFCRACSGCAASILRNRVSYGTQSCRSTSGSGQAQIFCWSAPGATPPGCAAAAAAALAAAASSLSLRLSSRVPSGCFLSFSFGACWSPGWRAARMVTEEPVSAATTTQQQWQTTWQS